MISLYVMRRTKLVIQIAWTYLNKVAFISIGPLDYQPTIENMVLMATCLKPHMGKPVDDDDVQH